MAVATMDPTWLQGADGTAEYIREKIDRCQAATAAVNCSFAILPRLWQMRQGLEELQAKIGELEINTDEDREWAKEQAQAFMRIAHKIEAAERKYKQLIGTVWPIFKIVKNANLRMLDETYCLAEDAAETLALVSSKEFMDSLKGDLRRIHGSA